MLTVPPHWLEARNCLMSTPTGFQLLTKDELADVMAEEVELNALGRSVDRYTIQLRRPGSNEPPLPPTHQACLLAHELTHCLDLAFWDVAPHARTVAMTGATEINAHYNQGLIARETNIAQMPGAAAMVNGNSTFGRMASAVTRTAVINQLAAEDQYQTGIRVLRSTKQLYVYEDDAQWEHGENLFHCEQHLAKNNPGLLAWS